MVVTESVLKPEKNIYGDHTHTKASCHVYAQWTMFLSVGYPILQTWTNKEEDLVYTDPVNSFFRLWLFSKLRSLDYTISMIKLLHVHIYTHISVYYSIFTCTKHAHQTHIHIHTWHTQKQPTHTCCDTQSTLIYMHTHSTHTCTQWHMNYICILNLLSQYLPVFLAGQLLIETFSVWSRLPIVVTVFKKFRSFVKLLQFGILTLQGKDSIILAMINAWGYDVPRYVFISVIVGTESMLGTYWTVFIAQHQIMLLSCMWYSGDNCTIMIAHKLIQIKFSPHPKLNKQHHC